MDEPPSRLKKRPCSTLGRKMPACDQPPYEELKQPSLPCFSIVSRMALAVSPNATSQLTCTKGSLPRSSGFVLPVRKPSRYDLRTMGPATRVLSYVRAMTPSVSIGVGRLSEACGTTFSSRPFFTVPMNGP